MSATTQAIEPTVPAVRLMGRDELNIAEFPIALLSPQNARQVNVISCKRQILLPNGQHLDQEWEVTGSEQYGLPLPGDQDVLLALLKLASDQEDPTPTVHFSRYEVLELLGWGHDGRNLRRVTEAVQRYWSARISSRNSFWNKARKEWTSHKGMGIIDAFEIVERAVKSGPGRSWVRFGAEFFESLASGYVKPLDLGTYLSLANNVTKRLYRYLDKHRYRRGSHGIDLYVLATAHIGFTGSVLERPATIKRALEPAHQELLDRGFLKRVEYGRARDGSWRVTYTFQPQTKGNEQLVLPGTAVEDEEPKQVLIKSLLARGITAKNARELVESKPLEYLEAQLDAFDFLLRLETGKPIHNPAGFLMKALTENWTVKPPGFVPRREREEREKVRAATAQERETQQQREAREKEEILRVREGLAPETLQELHAQAYSHVRAQFGKFQVKETSPVVEVFLNALIRERYLPGLNNE